MIDLMLNPLSNYARFKGRASRTEFWLFLLLCLVLSTIAFSMDYINAGYRIDKAFGIPNTIISTILFLPLTAVAVRRLHDANFTGLLLLAIFIPVIGQISLFVIFCLKGSQGDNHFGPDPRQPGFDLSKINYQQ